MVSDTRAVLLLLAGTPRGAPEPVFEYGFLTGKALLAPPVSPTRCVPNLVLPGSAFYANLCQPTPPGLAPSIGLADHLRLLPRPREAAGDRYDLRVDASAPNMAHALPPPSFNERFRHHLSLLSARSFDDTSYLLSRPLETARDRVEDRANDLADMQSPPMPWEWDSDLQTDLCHRSSQGSASSLGPWHGIQRLSEPYGTAQTTCDPDRAIDPLRLSQSWITPWCCMGPGTNLCHGTSPMHESQFDLPALSGPSPSQRDEVPPRRDESRLVAPPPTNTLTEACILMAGWPPQPSLTRQHRRRYARQLRRMRRQVDRSKPHAGSAELFTIRSLLMSRAMSSEIFDYSYS